MSKHRNRAKLNKANDNQEYRRKFLQYEYPMYYDECWHYKKGLLTHKWRSYKTWKHNRKTQYKVAG
jgi:hypothetical protein